MRALVTGGAGFIGSHLTDHLIELGHQVTVLDDLSTGSQANLASAAATGHLRQVPGSVCDPQALETAMEGVDAIYHLAAAVGVLTILERPLESLRTNLDGTVAVLEAARRHQVPVLVASSSEVYGNSTAAELVEDGDRLIGSPLMSRWSYAEAKAVDETLAFLYGQDYGLSTVIVRLFNTVGPRQSGRYGMVIPRLVEQALSGAPLTVYGDGQQVRCFCHVSDVVPALVQLLADPSAHGTVYNLGNPEPVTISELAERIAERTGSTGGVVKIPYERAYPAGFEDVQRRVPSCTKLHQQIGFQPKRTLNDIIDSMIASRRAIEAT